MFWANFCAQDSAFEVASLYQLRFEGNTTLKTLIINGFCVRLSSYSCIHLRGEHVDWRECMQKQIDLMMPADWPEVFRIYVEGIVTGLATFETQVTPWEEWDAARFPHSRLVARGEHVLGWAALSFVSKRSCYVGVAEVGIYVSTLARRCGIGRALLDALIESSEAHGIWTLQAATIKENSPSLALLAKCGFQIVGRRERIGKLGGIRRDTVLSERRSKTVGID